MPIQIPQRRVLLELASGIAFTTLQRQGGHVAVASAQRSEEGTDG